ncbi:MAG TPA: hypothetical protein VGS27_13380 [Candidatus Sulfotelmatobacter sp.]|nr:hypothetical protein [Candidatus Sulfotelmatobacter sp.]
MNPNTNISMLITSCNRHDLLKETLTTFYQTVDIVPQQIVIYEDSLSKAKICNAHTCGRSIAVVEPRKNALLFN